MRKEFFRYVPRLAFERLRGIGVKFMRSWVSLRLSAGGEFNADIGLCRRDADDRGGVRAATSDGRV
jgi:hypothetical protein